MKVHGLLFGRFRTSIDLIEKIILSDIEVFQDNKVIKIFQKIHGDLSLLVIDEREIKLFSSIYNSTLRIFKKRKFLITNKEFLNTERKISDDNGFLKLFLTMVILFIKV